MAGRLLLAPMEGVLDDILREVLTGIAGAGVYDGAVTEFVRVSDTVLPKRFFRRVAPELEQGGRTIAGTPVRVQLLGADPVCMAENAGRLAELAPAEVDLNFGCPAPTVNRHRGGAVLLDEPERLYAIARAVRDALPAQIRLTAKMRLGVRDAGRAMECAQALAAGGVGELVVHARTKEEGYRPSAHWEWVGRIASVVAVPVVANGEVWTVEDWRRCRSVAGVADVMLGRGAVADPFLAARIKAGMLDSPDDGQREEEWAALGPFLACFCQRVRGKVAARHAPGRLKQWLWYLQRHYSQARQVYETIRTDRSMVEIERCFRFHGIFEGEPQEPARDD